MPKSRSRYARAQARARYRKPKRRSGSFGWNIGIVLVAVIGIVLVVWTVAGRRSEASAAPRAGNPATGELGDHWHASLDVNVCGTWEPAAPGFEKAADNPNGDNVGIHSHGDGLIHIHPFNSSESGKNATVGRFFDYGGWSASSDSLDLWSGTDGKRIQVKNGGACTQADGTKKKGVLTWYVNGKKQSGDPSGYRPKNLDRIVLAFDPAGTTLASLGTPPNQASLPQPSDETPYTTTPSTPSTPAAPPPS